MIVKRMAVPVALNAMAAAAGVLGTTLIVWNFGLATYGIYAVGLAKVALLMLGIELLPSSYTQFKLQNDRHFADAAPAFYSVMAIALVAISALLIERGMIAGSSWFILPYIFFATVQKGIESQMLARGEVGLSVSVQLTSNAVRAALLALLIVFPALPAADVLWGSLFAGIMTSQTTLLARRPEIARALRVRRPIRAIRYLIGLRREYSGYYVNSLLKRLKDVLFPLFCDVALSNKAELGRLLVYTRSLEAVAGQIRVLELFLIHRQTRARLASRRKWILLGSALLGHVGVILLASFLLWNHGLTTDSILYAALIGLFLYPYVFELARRSDAYAALKPNKVTMSLATYLIALALALAAAWLLNMMNLPVLIGAIVLAQLASAIVYFARDGRGRPTFYAALAARPRRRSGRRKNSQ